MNCTVRTSKLNYKYITYNIEPPCLHSSNNQVPRRGIGMDILRNHPLQVSNILVIKLAFHAI